MRGCDVKAEAVGRDVLRLSGGCEAPAAQSQVSPVAISSSFCKQLRVLMDTEIGHNRQLVK